MDISPRQPRVLVTMCTYNGSRYLSEQLQSIAKQTRLPDELLVCDDASTDSTPELIRAFSEIAPFPVRLVCNPENLGLAANFEQALRMSDADLVLLSDQDDIWMPDKVEKLIWVGQSQTPCLAVHDARFLRNEQTDSGKTLLQHVVAVTGTDLEYVYGCCTALNRSMLQLALPFCNFGWGYDAWLHVLAGHLGKRHVISDVLIHYRRHASNASSFASYDMQMPLLFERLRRRVAAFRNLIGQSSGDLDSELERKRSTLVELRARTATSNSIDSRSGECLSQRLMRLHKRIELRRHPRWNRWWFASILYFTGGYTDFSGWKSWLVDVLCQRVERE